MATVDLKHYSQSDGADPAKLQPSDLNAIESAVEDLQFLFRPGGTVRRVGSTRTYTTVAAAIAAASSGDTILIDDGTYVETLTLKEGVNICGASFVGLQAKDLSPGVWLKGRVWPASNVVVSDVKIGSLAGSAFGDTGYTADDSAPVTLTDMKFLRCKFVVPNEWGHAHVNTTRVTFDTCYFSTEEWTTTCKNNFNLAFYYHSGGRMEMQEADWLIKDSYFAPCNRTHIETAGSTDETDHDLAVEHPWWRFRVTGCYFDIAYAQVASLVGDRAGLPGAKRNNRWGSGHVEFDHNYIAGWAEDSDYGGSDAGTHAYEFLGSDFHHVHHNYFRASTGHETSFLSGGLAIAYYTDGSGTQYGWNTSTDALDQDWFYQGMNHFEHNVFDGRESGALVTQIGGACLHVNNNLFIGRNDAASGDVLTLIVCSDSTFEYNRFHAWKKEEAAIDNTGGYSATAGEMTVHIDGLAEACHPGDYLVVGSRRYYIYAVGSFASNEQDVSIVRGLVENISDNAVVYVEGIGVQNRAVSMQGCKNVRFLNNEFRAYINYPVYLDKRGTACDSEDIYFDGNSFYTSDTAYCIYAVSGSSYVESNSRLVTLT